ncbi:hypothetical protein V8E55_009765 [Tylopilus felleus]
MAHTSGRSHTSSGNFSSSVIGVNLRKNSFDLRHAKNILQSPSSKMGEFRRGDPDALKSKTLVSVCIWDGSLRWGDSCCAARCTDNELHNEMVIRMPWYIKEFMTPCNWVALR